MMNFKALTRTEREAALKEMGLPAFREKQIFTAITRGARSFDEITTLSKDLRQKLNESYSWENVTVDLEQVSSDGTRKYLLALPDGNKVEAVFMKYEYGNSICISTQVGCNMGCRFCASAIGGKKRDLKAWEMLDEVLVCQKAAKEDVNHIVLMGIGEPLDNYEEVSQFLQLIHDPAGKNLSYRNITLSTCGIVPMISVFGKDFPQVNLAVSLHAANQTEREMIMPVAKAYNIKELISACRKHAELTGRRISFEYALMEGKNDQKSNADELAALLKGLLCHVNLIPLNPVVETGLKGSSRKAAESFKDMLEAKGIPCTVRRQLGADIDAACGQLRKKNSQESI